MAGSGWAAVTALTASNVVARVQLFSQALYYGSGRDGVGAWGMEFGTGIRIGVQVGVDWVGWEGRVGISGDGGMGVGGGTHESSSGH